MTRRRRLEVASTLAWFALAAFVLFRGLTGVQSPDLVTLFAAWLGGVASVGLWFATVRVFRPHERLG